MDLPHLRRVLKEECGLEPGQLLLVGFSGGPDSLAMLHALRELGQPLVAAHFDHGLRLESAEDARQANRISADLGIPFVTEGADVSLHAKQNRLSVEEAARKLRYAFLFRAASEQGAAAVAVAHNADDQAETVLMHLLRGAGPAGLSGMRSCSLPNSWSLDIPLIRPLLATWREQIEAYCIAHELTPLQDPSNQDTTYFRNRLRHDVLPLLESTVPGAKRRLAQSADLLAGDQELIAHLTESAWRRCLADRAPGYLCFNREVLAAEPIALQRALLRQGLAELRPSQRDVDYAAVQRALEHLAAGRQGTPVDWVAGLCLLVERQALWVADWEVELPVDWPQAPESPIHLEAATDLPLNDGWNLNTKVGQQPEADLASDDGFQAWLDLERSGELLTLRRRLPGDRFKPLGMVDGSMKLANFFINQKLPRRARDTWPLVCRGEQVIWVPGYQLAHPFRIQADTKRALHLQLRR